MARQDRCIGEVERTIIPEQYRRTGPLWDVVINDIVRDERFLNIPEKVRQLYGNVAQKPATRRRVREFIAREQRK